jgi:quercetin dioxygenase-like cupin family protein
MQTGAESLLPSEAMDIMSIQHFVVRPDQHERALNVVGTQVTVLASNATTQSYGITLQQGDEGTGPPPHSHDWDEAFYVLKGEVSFQCAGKTYACAVGTLVHVPRGTVHGFSYGSGGGQMLEITGAGALAAQMFKAVDSEIPSGPPDIPKLLDVLQRNGVTVAA